MQKSAFVVMACALISACSSSPQKAAQSEPPKPAAPVAAQPAPVAAETEAQRLDRIIKALAGKSVYFDYDDFTVKPEFQDLIKQDAEALRSAPKLSVRLEGNADERGSSEYNLALGQKRAEAVKRALEMLGLPDNRIEAVSFGKEKPRATCHEEKCWAENRRVDVVAKPVAAAQ